MAFTTEIEGERYTLDAHDGYIGRGPCGVVTSAINAGATLGRVYRASPDGTISRLGMAGPVVMLAEGDTMGGYLTRRAAHEVGEGSILLLSNGTFATVRGVVDGFANDGDARRPAVCIVLGRIGEPARVVHALASAPVLVRIPRAS